MAEVYGAVTDRILINLARHFKLIASGAKIPDSWEYQVRMLAEMGQVNRETEKIILDTLGDADKALQTLLEESIRKGLQGVEEPLRKAAEEGLLNGPGLLPPEVSPNQMQAFKTYYKQSADKLNLVNTVMLDSTEKAYQETISNITSRITRTQAILNTKTGEVVTGVTPINQAIRDGVKDMVKNGLTGFIDHGGHHWSPEAYVAMDIKTTMANTARAAVWERQDAYGSDLYQVSTHAGARPLCYPWQGKVISRSGWSGEVKDLDGTTIHVYPQSETSYGQAAGLFGVNCGHFPYPFVPGFSSTSEQLQDEEENAKAYEESQQQRLLERKLRAERLELEVLKAQGASTDDIKAQREKVRTASANLDDFCDATGRSRKRSREYTPVQADWRGAKIPPFEIPYTDIRNEYRAGYKPGEGTIAREGSNKEHEILTAQSLVKQIGGDITLIDNSGRAPVRDCTWHGKKWEIKQATSPHAASKRTELACKQISETGGNLIIDCCCSEYEEAERNVMTKLKAVAPGTLDVIILHFGKIKRMLRYKK